MPAFASLHDERITACDSTTAPAPTIHHQRAPMASSAPAATMSTAAVSHAAPIAVLIGSCSWLTSAQPNPLAAPSR